MANYWNQALTQRVTRRRGITTVGAGALGAAFLAACGGGSDSGSDGGKSSQPVSSLLTKPVDQTKEAKRGGTLKRNVSADVPNLDPMQNLAPAVPFTETVMGRLAGLQARQPDQRPGRRRRWRRWPSPGRSRPTA